MFRWEVVERLVLWWVVQQTLAWHWVAVHSLERFAVYNGSEMVQRKCTDADLKPHLCLRRQGSCDWISRLCDSLNKVLLLLWTDAGYIVSR